MTLVAKMTRTFISNRWTKFVSRMFASSIFHSNKSCPWTVLELQNLIYPVFEFTDSRINARLVRFRASNSPRYYARQKESGIIKMFRFIHNIDWAIVASTFYLPVEWPLVPQNLLHRNRILLFSNRRI